MLSDICAHDNAVWIDEQGYLNEDLSAGERPYYCPDCHKNFILDFEGCLIWESEEPQY